MLSGTLCAVPDIVYNQPLGVIAYTIGGGSTTIPNTTSFSIPLTDKSPATGVARGRISSLTSGTIVVPDANWTTGALALPAYPYAVRITTGVAAGVTLSVNANTTDTLTVSGRDLTTLGITAGANGDLIRLIPVDTLNSLFGSATLLGGATAADSDILTLSVASETSFYYNTSLGRWVRTTGPTTDRGNTPIPFDCVIRITRKSSAFALRISGYVPECRVNWAILNSGSTYTHSGFPQQVTLGNLALQNTLSGWVSNAAPGLADTIGVSSGANWSFYFHNGSYWQRTTGPSTNRDGIVIGVGVALQVFKQGTASGFSTFERDLPYSL